MTLSALIERLDAATGPDRDLDGEIALYFGWTFQKMKGDRHPYWRKPGDCHEYYMRQTSGPPHYTGSLDAALPDEEIVYVQSTRFRSATVWRTNALASDGRLYVGQGATEPLARRIAALRARSALGQGE